MAKVIYIHPECDVPFVELERVPKNELLTLAKNSNDMSVYDTLKDFEEDFNNEYISDLGFIFFMED